MMYKLMINGEEWEWRHADACYRITRHDQFIKNSLGHRLRL